MTVGRAPKRLLTIGHSYAVAVNRRLADALARDGEWDVTVAAPARFQGDFGWHTLEPGLGERCTVAPVPVHCGRPVHVMTYGLRLRSLLREPWDLVHCWEEPYVASAAQVAWWTSRRVPLVFATFQNIDKRYPPPFNWFERYTRSRADGIVAYGQTVRDVLVARGWASRPTRVISPGVDTTRFAPDASARAAVRAALGWNDDTPVVGFLGRFVHEKGLGHVESALDRLSRPWRALFVGSGPLEPDLRRWAARHPGRVAIETAVPHDQVPRWLNAMDMLVAPSQTTARWQEQFGRMLIEAFACGVPVIASNSGEIPHVVGEAGLIVPEDDGEGWLRAIDRLSADAPLRNDLSRRGRQRAVAVFDWAVVARAHLDFFDEMTALHPVGPAR
jgi:glycosyltransferase involved in cell wall biosynthesis